MSDVLQQLTDAMEAIRRARRVLLVHPDDYGPVTARIYADGMSGMVRVEQSQHVKPGQLILLNADVELPKYEPDLPSLPFGIEKETTFGVEPYNPGRIICSTVA